MTGNIMSNRTMPGLVVFRRRWSVGSDDLVVPGAFLLTTHLICLITIVVSLCTLVYDTTILDIKLLFYHQIGYVVILCASLCIEIAICFISMRGSILDSDIRSPINIWIYLKSAVMLFDITWLILGTIWLSEYYLESPINTAKKIFFAMIIANWALVFVTVVTVWCTFDAAGRSWVKMKKYQRSMRETESRFNYKRSNSMNRNWRQRKVIRAYQDSWDHRCRLLFCCMGSSEQTRNSFTDIARLLSDFFRELDVVPSDVVAGLVLLRKFQRLEREAIVRQRKNGTYEFLSGVPITERTQFLALNDAKNYDFFQTVIHYMYFAQGAYGWPMYFIINRSKMCNLIPELKCFGCCNRTVDEADVIKDNCCYCNYAALKKTLTVGDIEVVYVTYHVDIGETPFFVAIDYTQKKIVVSIRGTLSMKDILTDLNAEAEVLPLKPPRDDWLGHKGMVQAAIYIRQKLEEENLIQKALNKNPERNTHTFGLVLVGHSLGAGAAAILAILMKPEYPTLQCFSYSPPGGLLSMPAVEYSKAFITSVVLGKDVVPRIGLYQMEALRADLINAIQRSIDPKWKTISCSMICCGCGPEPKSVLEMSGQDTHINKYQQERDTARSTSTHPADSSIALTLHQPLYPPGRIIHIVRHHPKADENVLKSRDPVYQAIWADSTDFDEVLISPVMLQDHMPDKVLAALKKVVTTSGPRKPHRQASNAFSTTSNDLHRSNQDVYSCYINSNVEIHQQHHGEIVSQTSHVDTRANIIASSYPATYHSDVQMQQHHAAAVQQRVCLETSFTNLQSPVMTHKHTPFGESISSSKASSLAGSIQSRSQVSSIQYDISSVVENSIVTVQKCKSPVVKAFCSENSHKHEHDDHCLDEAASAKSSPIMHCNLQRHSSEKTGIKPKSLPIPPLRRASINTAEQAREDAWGVAPLASPETLSEISSISSRNSARNSLGNSIDQHLHHNSDLCRNSTTAAANEEKIYESQLHTPKVLRRAPKFAENLSTCAEDKRNLDQYKRMGCVFINHPFLNIPPQESSEDDEDDSFESATSYIKKSEHNGEAKVRTGSLPENKADIGRRQNSKSAEQLDDVTSNEKQTDIIVQKLNFSESNILDDGDTGMLENHANSVGSDDTAFFSANSSIERVAAACPNKNGVLFPQHLDERPIIMPQGVLETHFSLNYDPLCQNHPSTLPEPFTTTTTICLSNDKDHPIQQQQQQTVLVQIPKISSSPSFRGRKRNKNCIYPSGLATPITVSSTKLSSATTKTTALPEILVTNGSRHRSTNESTV